MRYTITFKEQDFDNLNAFLFSDRLVERAAYALCKISESDNETRLLVREIITVTPGEIERATASEIVISNRSFLRAMKRANDTKQVFLFIHSHPENFPEHSAQDDEEERKLFKLAYNRITTPGVHGSLVLSSPEKPVCRIWTNQGETIQVDLIRVLGNKFRFYNGKPHIDSLPIFFDRQIRAFGDEIQKVLQTLNVGIVGAGGTGSSIVEQLTRLGVGTLTIFDGQKFESSNVNRVYGSTAGDDGVEKVNIAGRNSHSIGVGTQIYTYNKPITFQSVAEKLKSCDIIFGCTDDHWGRSILTKLAVYYSIPVFDMGVKIHSNEGEIRSIQGRVTTLLSEYACLFCRERITAKQIEAECLFETDPERYQSLKKQGYADELEGIAPSIIPFTTNIATLAVSEFIHRLTGYMGAERESNEIIMLFDDSNLRRNKRLSNEACFCGESYYMMRGDTNPFLDLTWRTENENV